MFYLNKSTIAGFIGNNPVAAKTNNGSTVVNFSVATTAYWNDKSSGKLQEKTEWHNVVFFGKQAETIAKHIM